MCIQECLQKWILGITGFQMILYLIMLGHLWVLTHWGRMTHICVSKITVIGSDNGLSPERRQAIIWTNPGILLIWPLGANFSEIAIGMHLFSFKKMHLKLSSGKWRPFCLGLNVLKHYKNYTDVWLLISSKYQRFHSTKSFENVVIWNI